MSTNTKQDADRRLVSDLKGKVCLAVTRFLENDTAFGDDDLGDLAELLIETGSFLKAKAAKKAASPSIKRYEAFAVFQTCIEDIKKGDMEEART